MVLSVGVNTAFTPSLTRDCAARDTSSTVVPVRSIISTFFDARYSFAARYGSCRRVLTYVIEKSDLVYVRLNAKMRFMTAVVSR